MADMRTFYASDVDLREMAKMISSWLQINDFESQIINLPDGSIAVQARQPELWRSVLGMSSAMNITLRTRGSDLVVETDAGRWADKVAVGAVGAFILHPLLITLAYGAWKQCQLPDRVLCIIEQFLRDNQASPRAARIPVQSSNEPTLGGNIKEMDNAAAKGTICQRCGLVACKGAKYCGRCGAILKPASIKID
jgi:hypothetical protein